MTVQFRVHRLHALPPLAWCARLDAAAGRVDLWCGAWVETGADYFWEGAWCGAFAGGAFERCPDRMGSGGRLTSQGLVLVPPSHAIEKIHLFRADRRAFASNSLPFLLASAGRDLDPTYPFYRDDFWSLVGGEKACVRRIPTDGSAPVELLYVDPVLLGADLHTRTLPPSPAPDWRTYEEYRAKLAEAIGLLVANAAAPGRRHRFEPVATLSSGYDSPASAALAREAGCVEAITFREGRAYRSGGGVRSDSGREIGLRLGLRVEEIEYAGSASVPESTAAEIAACGDAFDLKLCALEPRVGGRLLVTGVRGGAAWDVEPARPFDPYACQDPSGTSLGEWRLRAGFIHAAPPLIDVRARRRMFELTESDAMRPWVLGGDYDRPLPRRILEEKGVPRGAFARIKLGSFDMIHFENLGPTSWPGFEEFASGHRRALGAGGTLRLRARHHLARLHRRAWLATRRRSRNGLIPGRSRFEVPWPGRSAAVVPWGVAVLRERYRRALERATGAGNAAPVAHEEDDPASAARA